MNRTEYIGKLNALYVGEKNCLEELITTYDEKDQEIERLKGLCDKYEEEHKTTFEEWKKTINIIKEAREYIEHYETIRGYYEYEENGYDEYNYEEDLKQELLEILDKGKE